MAQKRQMRVLHQDEMGQDGQEERSQLRAPNAGALDNGQQITPGKLAGRRTAAS